MAKNKEINTSVAHKMSSRQDFLAQCDKMEACISDHLTKIQSKNLALADWRRPVLLPLLLLCEQLLCCVQKAPALSLFITIVVF